LIRLILHPPVSVDLPTKGHWLVKAESSENVLLGANQFRLASVCH
jgi:hypothetical protein